MASVREPLKVSPRKSLRLQWAPKYITLDVSCILFTDETRATLNKPDGWANGWVDFGHHHQQHLRGHLQGRGIML